jgi:hypothetical protein
MEKKKSRHYLLQFGSETGVTDFSYSNGWLQLEMPVKNQLQVMPAVLTIR